VITTPTVLVLGAGASYPYGFPTAKGLKELICQAFSDLSTSATLLLSDESDELRYTPPSAEEFFQFREAFLKSGQPSVDAFLERRPNFLRVGKLAIAYCLIPFEDEAKLYRPDLSRGGDWYEYLSTKLNSSFEEFGNNKLSIITFNYDRSVEHYLLNSLLNLHGKEPDKCANALAQIPIVHVYGQLGKHPYPQGDCLQYRPDLVQHAVYVRRAAAGITLYHEEAEAASAAARELLRTAKRVCFLGFSYHPLNIARLNIGGSFDLSTLVFGTARGLIGLEVDNVRNRLAEAIGGDTQLSDTDNLDILRRNMLLD
jgi:hypothetical protein